MTHPSHDFAPPSWICSECGVFAGHLIASSFPCVPATDDAPRTDKEDAE